MKAVVLAGGYGTRISEETTARPKPMVEIGGKPILWHILKIFSTYGINDFVICCGYKGYAIKEYFANYVLHMGDVTIDMARAHLQIHHQRAEPWKVTLVDTGLDTMTGGRLRRVREFLDNETFCMTYGDGVADIDIARLVTWHAAHKKYATVTAVQPPGRFGALSFAGDAVAAVEEKPKGDGGWINGGFFVLEPAVLDFIDGDNVVWEQEPMRRLAAGGQLMAYRHNGFWQAMDTLRDKVQLENRWAEGQAPWKVWT
ncbi:MAG: glucose-1-phosphate cytidylyltransferase [Alphaproteobacteria bacterium]|nr:glucose-1-phosphate cytidylyltransferase [Alphaproteobacteria bacterium]